MLFVPMTARANFWAMKFISFVDFEHEKKPTADGEKASRVAAKPLAAFDSASCQVATRKTPFSRTIGSVIRVKGSNLNFVINLNFSNEFRFTPASSGFCRVKGRVNLGQ